MVNETNNKSSQEVNFMLTDKELKYVEDALNHERLMKTKCDDYANQMQDRELKVFMKDLVTRHQSIYNSIFKLLQ